MQSLTYIFCTLLALANSPNLIAQPFKKSTKNLHTRPWQNGALTWKDFRNITSPDSYLLYYGLDAQEQKYKCSDTIFVRTVVSATIDTTLSYASASMKNAATLRHCQLSFDLIELNRRALQDDIDTEVITTQGSFMGNGSSQKFDNYWRKANSQIEFMSEETRKGTDSIAMDKWRNFAALQLEQHPAPILNCPPHFSAKTFGVGFSASPLLVIATVGDLQNHIPSTMGGGLEVFFSYKKHRISDIIGMSTTTVKKPINGIAWNENESISAMSANLLYGYEVVDTKKWRIVPQIGYVGVGYEQRNSQKESVRYDASGLGGCIDVEYKLIKHLDMTPTTRSGFYELNILGRVITPFYNTNTVTGLPIVASIGVTGRVYGLKK